MSNSKQRLKLKLVVCAICLIELIGISLTASATPSAAASGNTTDTIVVTGMS